MGLSGSRLVMTDFMDGSNSVKEMLEYLTEDVVGELMENYPEVKPGSRLNLRTVMNVTDGNHTGTVTYSPLTYCYSAANSETSNVKLKNTVNALYLYFEAAKAYFPADGR